MKLHSKYYKFIKNINALLANDEFELYIPREMNDTHNKNIVNRIFVNKKHVKMETGVFAETAPPPQSLINATDDYFENRQILAFQDQLLSTIDAVQPRIQSLENTIRSAEKSFSASSGEAESFLNTTLSELQTDMPELHETSIKLSRKIQNLSLKAQTATTIAAPKQLRPIHEEFFAFKDEFDQSLKNIATLTKNLNNKIDKHNVLIKKFQENSNSVKRLDQKIDRIMNHNKENAKLIEELKINMASETSKSRSPIVDKFEQSLTDAENLVSELEILVDKGLANSNETIVKLQSDKFDIQSSFENLTNEIDSIIQDRINGLHSKINRLTEKSDNVYNTLNSNLTIGLDKVTSDVSLSPIMTILDKIEEKHEAEELDILMEKIDRLKQGIRNHTYDVPDDSDSESTEIEVIEISDSDDYSDDNNDNKKDTNEEEDDDDPCKTCYKMVNGKKIRYYCFPRDWTYET
ncbi:hypothetical protein TRFO_27161 [Tritrichomonas foetus]|uniref:Uncharacterized protein n=1 Tax=Tritrichomonas foetus TaxID=1144522 RepID=A0A1J4K6A0_9EUKA|nr:hypothetical protein TRFO_27161 [Tritrichomonas foetus]|eukprot:OHT05214.1 hypothetical protein TRFO_27161 [Tritrichomonas foetus]